jgi:predicted RNase H-like nuclease
VPLDDVLDAAAAAWSADRLARGEAEPLPDPPAMVDGREVAIWF